MRGAQAAFRTVHRIQINMRTRPNRSRLPFCATFVRAMSFALLLSGGPLALGQESPQAPMAPPPEHEVKRMSNVPEAPAPPALPPEEIIRRFSQKEDQYMTARPTYGFRKTIRIDEFDRDG